jgi:hypothetical protein
MVMDIDDLLWQTIKISPGIDARISKAILEGRMTFPKKLRQPWPEAPLDY